MKPIYGVAGVARSGTSMMMKVLIEGGIEGYYEDKKNKFNPNGFYESAELSKIKDIDSKNIDFLCGKVIKMLPWFFEYLYEDYDYKIIFMRREIEEIIMSQKLMYFEKDSIRNLSRKYMKMKLEKDIDNYINILENKRNVSLLFVNYNDLMNNSEIEIKKIINFIPEINFNINKMLSVPDKDLYRNRLLENGDLIWKI